MNSAIKYKKEEEEKDPKTETRFPALNKRFVVGGMDEGAFYVPASYIMYLSDFCRFLLCTCGWERGGARESGIECILYGYS